MAALKILHTADWQIGAVLNMVSGDDGAVLRERRFEMVADVARTATQEGADAVLVAGDVFETNDVHDRSIDRVLSALGGFAGPWVLLPGNHDPARGSSVWTRMAERGCAENVILATEEAPILRCDGRLAVLPAVLRRKHEALDTTAWFNAADTPDGVFRVGLAHGGIEGPRRRTAKRQTPSPGTAQRQRGWIISLWATGTVRAKSTGGPGMPAPRKRTVLDPSIPGMS